MEKERENARMEAKRRKLMEKRVRIHDFIHSGLVVVVFQILPNSKLGTTFSFLCLGHTVKSCYNFMDTVGTRKSVHITERPY